jgi:hypothetical protein
MNGGSAAAKIIIDQPEESVDQMERVRNSDLVLTVVRKNRNIVHASIRFLRLVNSPMQLVNEIVRKSACVCYFGA